MKTVPYLLLLVLLSACRGTPVMPRPTATPLPAITLQPYASRTPQPQASATFTAVTPLPSPTPTPFVYTIVKDDTLLGIAARFGVSLDDLLTANPGIDPRFLTIGLTLTIPLSSNGNQPPSQGVQIPLELTSPVCFPLPDSSRWCVVQVFNRQDFPVASVTLLWTLPESQETFATALPLEILPPGAGLPLGVVLPAGREYPQVSIRSVLPTQAGVLAWPQMRPPQEMTPPLPAPQVTVRNSITPPKDGASAVLVWLGIGYDANAQPVALCQGRQNPAQADSLIYTCTLTAPKGGLLAAVEIWEAWEPTEPPK
ncbi:MAG: hypothetical protein Fur0018_19260 [Anaerolineales bacterium]